MSVFDGPPWTSGAASEFGAPTGRERCAEVAVMGGGVAGLATSIHLARRGVSVICIDPRPGPAGRVGESLDWSAPALLDELGLPRDRLTHDEAATYKRAIEVRRADGETFWRSPLPWFARWPLRFERTTLHVDRDPFDRTLYDVAVAAGVEFVSDSVSGLESEGDRLLACRTRDGDRIRASYFVDASGGRRLIGRALDIGTRRYGRPKVAIWAQLIRAREFEGTTLYPRQAGYLAWAWEIPLTPGRDSVGVVLPRDEFRARRRAASTLEALFLEALNELRNRPTAGSELITKVRARGVQPCVSERVTGRNWIMAGECAAFVDPLTSYGVTAALRHAAEGAALLLAAADRAELPPRRRATYERNVRGVADAYNRGIESTVYDEPVRAAFGTRAAVDAYVPFGYFANVLYSRVNSGRPAASLAFVAVLRLLAIWPRSWRLAARLVTPLRGAAHVIRRGRRSEDRVTP